jgi:hypothetical protein
MQNGSDDRFANVRQVSERASQGLGAAPTRMSTLMWRLLALPLLLLTARAQIPVSFRIGLWFCLAVPFLWTQPMHWLLKSCHA